MRICLALAVAISLIAVGSVAATVHPNLKITVADPSTSPCNNDMPCDPPVRSSVLVLTRFGAVPMRVRIGGAGTIWLHVHPGLYTAKLTPVPLGSVARSVSVRVLRTGVATLRLVLGS
jgi:hypothetical protein